MTQTATPLHRAKLHTIPFNIEREEYIINCITKLLEEVGTIYFKVQEAYGYSTLIFHPIKNIHTKNWVQTICKENNLPIQINGGVVAFQ